LRSGIDRRVHDGIIKVLALNRRVIAHHDIAVMQTLTAVYRKPIAHRHADRVGDKHRHAAGTLSDQFAFSTD
jgi:hypothetical protein